MASPALQGTPVDVRVGSCRSFPELGSLETLQVLGPVAEGILRANGGKLDDAAKAKLIEAVRANQHVELAITAITFRQRDGSPNKNYFRFKAEKLGDIAGSFVGKPALVDHNKWEQGARIGTITASELAELPHGWAGFRQTIRVVKPHAVISVLDGTIDRFSIGWDPRYPILCTAHKVDIRSSKSCWFRDDCYPGKKVELDGGGHQIAEWEWQNTEGIETSGVNTPAVTGTRIEDIRSSLATEFNLQRSEGTMTLPRLAAALKFSALTDVDDERAALRVQELERDKLAAEQERDSVIKERDALKAELAAAATAKKTAEQAERKTKVDAMLATAYSEGRLLHGRDEAGKATPSLREARLRRIGMDEGTEVLATELAEMPKLAPVGTRVLNDDIPEPPRARGALPSSVLASTARQLGLDPKELEDHANKLEQEA